MELTIDQAFHQSGSAHREGRFEEAASLYHAILKAQPTHPDANHNLGILYVSLNKSEIALPLLKTALEVNPTITQFWVSYIDVLIREKQFKDAELTLEQAKHKGFFGSKFDILSEQINHKNNSFSPPNLQFKKLFELYQSQKYAEAEELALQITKQFPKDKFPWKILANVYSQTGRMADGIKANKVAVKIDPRDAEIYNNLGNIQCKIGLYKEAEKNYRKVLNLDPGYIPVYNNLGNLIEQLGLLNEAKLIQKQAINLKPDFAAPYNNLGNILNKLGKHEEAKVNHKKAISLEQNNNDFYHSKNICLNYSSMWSPLNVYEEHIEFENQFGGLDIRTSLDFKNFKHSGDKLRIGYISGDFKSHSVSYFFEPLLQHHNVSVVETVCYYNDSLIDDTTKRLMTMADHWRSIFGMSHMDVVNLIKNDKIDILVDLSGHTSKNRLLVFAQKPAPIQVSWLGYPNTTGLSAIDYRFTDIIADPIGEADDFHSETLLRLPNGFQCYKGNEKIDVNINLPQKYRDYITFGSFNNLSKMTPEVIMVWAKILKAVPNSKLLIKSSILNHDGQHYLNLFKQEDIAADRIEYHKRLANNNEHLELYNKIDICLDTFCFNGATTTCEALWMGVPVITLLGDRHSGRVGASILTNIGLTDFIAQDIDDYVALAIKMSNRPEYLKEIRQGLRKQMLSSPLCNGQSFAIDIESAYKSIWNKYLKSYR